MTLFFPELLDWAAEERWAPETWNSNDALAGKREPGIGMPSV
jgi:hypothetical protein